MSKRRTREIHENLQATLAHLTPDQLASVAMVQRKLEKTLSFTGHYCKTCGLLLAKHTWSRDNDETPVWEWLQSELAPGMIGLGSDEKGMQHYGPAASRLGRLPRTTEAMVVKSRKGRRGFHAVLVCPRCGDDQKRTLPPGFFDNESSF